MTFDPWRDNVSEALGRIEANLTSLVTDYKQGEHRITALEQKQWKRDGVLGAAVLLLPFLVDPFKKFLNIG